MPKHEYMEINRQTDESVDGFMSRLTTYSEAGWEVVAVTPILISPTSGTAETASLRYLLKRVVS